MATQTELARVKEDLVAYGEQIQSLFRRSVRVTIFVREPDRADTGVVVSSDQDVEGMLAELHKAVFRPDTKL